MLNLEREFENFITDTKVLDEFRINKFFPLLEGNPEAVLKPQDKEDILKIIKIAKKNGIPLIPYSSVWDFYGSSLALNGGIIVDLRNLNKIEKVRECYEGMNADIQPGVSFEELNDYLVQYNLRSILPLRLPSHASVLSTYYGKHPLLEANKYGFQQDWMLLTYQLAIHKGYFIGTGSEGLETNGKPGAFPFSPRMDIGRMLLGALGAFGIVSRATCKLKYRPEKYEFLYTDGSNIEDLISKTREISMKTEAAQTVLISDSKILAGLLADTKSQYLKYKDSLPDWTTVIALAGDDDMINVEREDLYDAADEIRFKITSEEYFKGFSSILEEQFRYAKNVGISFDFNPYLRIEFYSTANKIGRIRANISKLMKESNINEEEKIGFMLNSIEFGRTYYCEYDIFHGSQKINPHSLPNIGNLNLLELYRRMLEIVIKSGGVINLPRNKIISDMLYNQENMQSYYNMLRILKHSLDPTNIMHPSIIFNGEGGVNPMNTMEVVK